MLNEEQIRWILQDSPTLDVALLEDRIRYRESAAAQFRGHARAFAVAAANEDAQATLYRAELLRRQEGKGTTC